MLRVVIDPNVFVSAVITPEGVPAARAYIPHNFTDYEDALDAPSAAEGWDGDFLDRHTKGVSPCGRRVPRRSSRFDMTAELLVGQ